jgi:hypothetical protein
MNAENLGDPLLEVIYTTFTVALRVSKDDERKIWCLGV